MKLPRFSVRRPIFTTMVTLILVILGAVSLSRLQIDMLPDIELPTLTIRTDYEGASPEVMETLVTRILEEIIAQENKRKPLSDQKLQKALEDKGYNIARRTVAKYREQLNIPVARLRKEL